MFAVDKDLVLLLQSAATRAPIGRVIFTNRNQLRLGSIKPGTWTPSARPMV